MESQHHLIIVGSAVYLTFGADGKENGEKKCWIYHRCWCLWEMAIRDCIAVKILGHQKSEIIVLDEFLGELISSAESGRSIAAAIAERFRSTNFFEDMQGRPEDVQEIQSTLISGGFFESPEHFNEHFRKRMVSVLLECSPQVRQPSSFHRISRTRSLCFAMLRRGEGQPLTPHKTAPAVLAGPDGPGAGPPPSPHAREQPSNQNIAAAASDPCGMGR